MRKLVLLLNVLLGTTVAVFLFAPWIPGLAGPPRRTITLYGFSILGDVMNRAVFPAFAKRWEAQTGEQVELISAFAGSGTVTNQIKLGVPAQVAILSLELDAMALEKAGVLDGKTWKELPQQGVLNQTPFVILTRPGNPKGIEGFDSLARPGMQVVHPDPLTSGGAQWAILAEFGSVTLEGGSQREAVELLTGLWRNVVAQASSARAARTQFEGGFGDALITYEQELVVEDKLHGEIVYPSRTVLSDHIVIVVERNIEPQDRELIAAFVEYLWSREAQGIFVSFGFRSLTQDLNSLNPKLIPLEHPFTVEDLGGWQAAHKSIVQSIWMDQVMVKIGKS
ncbi:MAG: substrate-binding domain-containing protein [Vulcanimicrobiota bacterium]